MITTYGGGLTTASHKMSQASDEGLRCEIRHQLKVNCFYWQWDKNACIGFDNSWLMNKSILDVKWLSIINTNLLKDRIRSGTFDRKLSLHLRLGFAELQWQMVQARAIKWTILRQPMMCRRRQSEEERSVFGTYDELCYRMLPMKDYRV